MVDNLSRTKRSSQAIDNFSFDEDFLVKVVELVKRNQAGTAIEYFNPATEEKQAEFSIPDFDEKVVDETDPNNITITYKKDGLSVAVKTIAVSGDVTTITVI